MPNVTRSLDTWEYYISPATLPCYSGIYCVYACTYNALVDIAFFRRLLYIGESGNIRNRVSKHEHWDDWVRKLQDGEVLLSFGTTPISLRAGRERVEAAMIHHHKPPCNTQHVYSFPFDQTTIIISGKEPRLDPYFTVYHTTKPQKGLAAGLGTWNR